MLNIARSYTGHDFLIRKVNDWDFESTASWTLYTSTNELKFDYRNTFN